MLFRSLKNFENPDRDTGLVFFVQRLEELTFDYSLDSYKSPAVSVPYLIMEALSQLKILDRDEGQGLGSAIPIIDELAVRIRGNPVVAKLVRSERQLIDHIKSLDEKNADRELKYLKNEISPHAYSNQIMESLIVAIGNNEKSLIDYLIRELVATQRCLGMSRRHIYTSSIQFFYLSSKKNEINNSNLNEYFRIIFHHNHLFEILFKVSDVVNSLEVDNFGRFGLSISSDIPDEFEQATGVLRFKKLGKNEKFIKIDGIRSYDKYSAIGKARRQIGLLRDMFRLYHHKEDFRLSESALVKQCCVKGVNLVSKTPSRMLNVYDDRPKKAAQKLDKIVKNSQLPRGPDRQRFFAVTEFHSMSVDAKSIENQITNLWIALETLSPSRKKHTKINNVIAAVIPAIGLKYFNRLVDRLAFDLLSWNRRVSGNILRRASKDVEVNKTQDRLLRLLALQENLKFREELYAELGNFELLRYRTFRLSEIFSSTNRLTALLEEHIQRVQWQLRRIYRARNSIVHLGARPPFANALVDNAHDYLDQSLKLVMELSCGPSGFDSLENSFNYLSQEWSAYKRKLGKIDFIDSESINSLLWTRLLPPERASILS